MSDKLFNVDPDIYDRVMQYKASEEAAERLKNPILFVIEYQDTCCGVPVYSMTTDHPEGSIENRKSLEADDIFGTMELLTAYYTNKGYKVQFEVK